MPEITAFSTFVIAALILAIVVVLMAVKAVPQGMEYTVERFGRFTRALSPGLNFIMPIIDRIGAKMNMMESVLDVPEQEVITRDNAMVTAGRRRLLPGARCRQAAYEVTSLQNAMLNLALTNLRTVMGSMDLDELLSQRDQINAKLLSVIDDATNAWGVKVTRVEIKNITPPRDIVDAMARQMKAERESAPTSWRRKACVRPRSSGRKGRSRRSSFPRRDDGKPPIGMPRRANARPRAEAQATEKVSEAIAQGNVQAINYFVALKYIDALREFANGNTQKTLFLPLEAASVIGAIGGIGEIAREAFDKKKDSPLARGPAPRGLGTQ